MCRMLYTYLQISGFHEDQFRLAQKDFAIRLPIIAMTVPALQLDTFVLGCYRHQLVNQEHRGRC